MKINKTKITVALLALGLFPLPQNANAATSSTLDCATALAVKACGNDFKCANKYVADFFTLSPEIIAFACKAIAPPNSGTGTPINTGNTTTTTSPPIVGSSGTMD